VECLWEPYMMLAARLRGELGLPGLTAEQTVPFRDKELMKQLLGAAGLRKFGKPGAVLYDVKYILPKADVDGRL